MQDRPHQCTYVAQENVVILPHSAAVDFAGIDHPDVRFPAFCWEHSLLPCACMGCLHPRRACRCACMDDRCKQTPMLQVGKHFEGRDPARMEYVPNAYLRYRYPEDWGES